MLHQMEQGAKPFKRPKVTKVIGGGGTASTFEQELQNILGVSRKERIGDDGNTTDNRQETEKVTTGMNLQAATVDSAIGRRILNTEASAPSTTNINGIDISEVSVEQLHEGSYLLQGSGKLETFFPLAGIKYVSISQRIKDPARPERVLFNLHKLSDKYDETYLSPFANLGTVFDTGGDVNQFIRIFTILFSDWCMSMIVLIPHLKPDAGQDPIMQELAKHSTFADICVKSASPGLLQNKIGHKIVDLVTFINFINAMSFYATETEKTASPKTKRDMILRGETFQSKAERDFQLRLLEITEEYTSSMSLIKNGLQRLVAYIPQDQETDNPEFLKDKQELVANIREVALDPITKSKQQLDTIAQLKKDLAVKTLEIKKLTKQLGNNTTGVGFTAQTTSIGNTTTLSKEQQLLNKKTFDLLLPLKIREVFIKYPAYRYGLTMAGKIHLRNEQSIFVTDITQLVYIQHESNPASTILPVIDPEHVIRQVEQTQKIYLKFLTETPSDIMRECSQLLTPVMVSVLQTCLNQTKQLVEQEAAGRTITAGVLLCPKKDNTPHEILYDKFTSWVASVYISDQQIQKNIATTQSDKNAQNLARLRTILELRQGLRGMGYMVKDNPYSA